MMRGFLTGILCGLALGLWLAMILHNAGSVVHAQGPDYVTP
jgi:hypothetical protein